MLFKSKIRKYLILSLICLPIICWFENCSPSGSSFDADSLVAAENGAALATPLGGLSATSVSIAPSSQTVAPSGSLQMYATGGTPPYTFQITGGGGAVTTTGLFVAPSYNEVDTVQAMDSTGQISTAVITVNSNFGAFSSETPVYQFISQYTGEHYYSTSAAEGTGYGYTYQGAAFMVVTSSNMTGFIGLYRCVIPGGFHFLSADPNCEGESLELQLGYIYSTQVSGTTPLYRYYLSSNGDYLTTIDSVGATAAGYSYLGIIGYVPTQ
jgi:hypothetical protein